MRHPSLECVLLMVLLASGVRAAEPRTEASRILEAAGVKGGLIVHLGCGDGKLTAALRTNDRFLVHGLDADAQNIAAARRHIHSLGVYGKISVQQWSSRRLPYADNLVNLIVVSGGMAVERDELLRVLAPNGVALFVNRQSSIANRKLVKPRPKELDDWTHYLHSPGNNAVSHDTVVGPPQHLQWVVEPKWARSHDHLATVSAAVSAGGRLFYIVDEAPTASVALAPKWFLVARDAFNGVFLWKQPVESWQYHLRGFRSGPAELARRLVAIGDRVYVTLGYGKPICALDAATGRTLQTYAQTANTTEFICHDGVLLAVTTETTVGADAEARLDQTATEKWNFWSVYSVPAANKRLLAVRADSGQTLWTKSGPDVAQLMPTALAAAGRRVFFENLQEVICADLASGKELWRTARPLARQRPTWTAPTLVACGDVVLSADRGEPAGARKNAAADGEFTWTVNSAGGFAPLGEMIAFSAKTGERLWNAPAREGYNSPVDLLVAGGLVWSGDLVKASDPGITQGRDLATGEVRQTRPRDQEFYANGMGHHRCYRNKATDHYLITGRAGAEFIELATGKAVANHWTRGTCQYGVMPANGLLYVPPHACACFIQSKLNSFNALAPARPSRVEGRESRVESKASGVERVERGPAFDEIANRKSPIANPQDWPTYRHDAARSGSTATAVPASVATAWQAKIGGRLSAPVIAGGQLFVAAVDTHEVCALDAVNGKSLWRFVADGRVDSPPTVHDGLVLFGCADGWVYCLQAATGQLAWRFCAAPADERIMAYGQLESPWPVHGSVLVKDSVVFCAAGRSSFLDGGIMLRRLDARTGKPLSLTRVDDRDGTGQTGHLNDVLSCDGGLVFMRHESFGLEGQLLKRVVPHLHSSAGFLDDDWWHRTYWIYGGMMASGWGQWPSMGNRVPSGQIMVMNKDHTYGFGRVEYANGVHAGLNARYHLFSCVKESPNSAAAPTAAASAKKRRGVDKAAPKAAAKAAPKATVRWSVTVPLLARAMVLADRTLFVAGPPEGAGVEGLAAAHERRTDGMLWAVAADTGRQAGSCRLPAPPVWDGLTAANNRLYVSTADGQVLCLAGQRQTGIPVAKP